MAPTQRIVIGSATSWPGPDPANCCRTSRDRSPGHGRLRSWLMTPKNGTRCRGAVHPNRPGDDVERLADPRFGLAEAYAASPRDLFEIVRQAGFRALGRLSPTTVRERVTPRAARHTSHVPFDRGQLPVVALAPHQTGHACLGLAGLLQHRAEPCGAFGCAPFRLSRDDSGVLVRYGARPIRAVSVTPSARATPSSVVRRGSPSSLKDL